MAMKVRDRTECEVESLLLLDDLVVELRSQKAFWHRNDSTPNVVELRLRTPLLAPNFPFPAHDDEEGRGQADEGCEALFDFFLL